MTDSKQELARTRVLALLAEAGGSAAPSETRRQFREFAQAHVDCCERSCVPGHFTGSAWLVSADAERALLMHHRKLGIWVQPGGHADGDGDLAAVALREAGEETGVQGLRLHGGVFDLDRHLIPPRGKDPAHFHYDVRFVVRAGACEDFVVNEESHALAWRPMQEIAADTQADESVRRMARKWLAKIGQR
jgi:8-oxo-dGTP pyrophosphatase MutT (NUDIX family)